MAVNTHLASWSGHLSPLCESVSVSMCTVASCGAGVRGECGDNEKFCDMASG